MTAEVMTSGADTAPRYRLYSVIGGVARAMRWAVEVERGCHRARVAGETLDADAIRRIGAAADAALGVV